MVNYIYSVLLLAVLTEINSYAISKANSRRASLVDFTINTIYKRSVNERAGFDVELKAFDKTHNLKLRSPDHSVFSDNFQYHDIDVDENGKTFPLQRFLSKREIQNIEGNIFTDFKSGAVLNIRNVDDEFHLNGLIDNIRIRRDTENGTHVATEEDLADTNSTDYIDIKRPYATPRGISLGKIAVSPEIAFVYDFENSKLFNFDIGKITEYIAIMVNAINSRYASIDDPKITFKLSGIYSIKTAAAQPFVEKAKLKCPAKPSGNCEVGVPYVVDISVLLGEFQTWALKNLKQIAMHDLVGLLCGSPSMSSTTGMATARGACLLSSNGADRSGFASIDTNGIWEYVNIIAHEIAHGLGSDHDEHKKGCEASQQYIMAPDTYYGDVGRNSYLFSKCSADGMKKFIQSTGGSCLWKQSNPKPLPESKFHIGDRMSPAALCQKKYGAAIYALKPRDPALECQQWDCVEKVDNKDFMYQTLKTSLYGDKKLSEKEKKFLNALARSRRTTHEKRSNGEPEEIKIDKHGCRTKIIRDKTGRIISSSSTCVLPKSDFSRGSIQIEDNTSCGNNKGKCKSGFCIIG